MRKKNAVFYGLLSAAMLSIAVTGCGDDPEKENPQPTAGGQLHRARRPRRRKIHQRQPLPNQHRNPPLSRKLISIISGLVYMIHPLSKWMIPTIFLAHTQPGQKARI